MYIVCMDKKMWSRLLYTIYTHTWMVKKKKCTIHIHEWLKPNMYYVYIYTWLMKKKSAMYIYTWMIKKKCTMYIHA